MLSADLAAVTIAERAKAAHMLLSHQSGIDRCVRTADSADTLCLRVPYLTSLHKKELPVLEVSAVWCCGSKLSEGAHTELIEMGTVIPLLLSGMWQLFLWPCRM
ncbi:hypothetical protein QQF64_033301 [Cirrhinus molitorella]|uniref:Uncharacterized protein n=1 Tax=Cirrhinus molitorella TaxID=172907 RepID=A0ABR3MTG7_9TELE